MLCLSEADLFRVGNAESPKLDHIRAADVDAYNLNGLRMVQANGKGISPFSEEELAKRRFAGWVWKLPAGTVLPDGLGLHNDYDGHFMLCPITSMLLDTYRALLDEIALSVKE